MRNDPAPVHLADRFEKAFEEHYETLEKLYSLVVTIKYILDREDYILLSQLYMAKAGVLREVENHKQNLDKWIGDLQREVMSPQFKKKVHQKLEDVRKLAEKIIALEKENSARIERLKDQSFFPSEERSVTCELKNLI